MSETYRTPNIQFKGERLKLVVSEKPATPTLSLFDSGKNMWVQVRKLKHSSELQARKRNSKVRFLDLQRKKTG